MHGKEGGKLSNAAVDARIADGAYYDALQLARAVFERMSRKGDLEAGIAFAEKYAEQLAEHQQFELTVNLGDRVFEELLRRREIQCSDELCERLSTFFLLCPPNSTDSKYLFMDKLINWSKQCVKGVSDIDQQENGSKWLHGLVAEAYLAENKFGACQNHLVFCEDAKTMAELVTKWQRWGYPSERHLFFLRLILMLLSRNQIRLAGQLFEEMKYDLDGPSVPGPVQAAYLAWAACVEMCHELFEIVQKKYVLLFRLDPTLQRLLGIIETVVFGIQSEQGGLMSVLKQMMGGGALSNPMLSASTQMTQS